MWTIVEQVYVLFIFVFFFPLFDISHKKNKNNKPLYACSTQTNKATIKIYLLKEKKCACVCLCRWVGAYVLGSEEQKTWLRADAGPHRFLFRSPETSQPETVLMPLACELAHTLILRVVCLLNTKQTEERSCQCCHRGIKLIEAQEM